MACSAGQAIRAPAIAGLVIALLIACGPAQKESAMEQVDALFSGLISDGEPGAAVLVADETGVVFERGYGVTDLRTRRRIDSRTNFRLASVTKQFTAAAVMLLVRDGKLRYEDSLTDVFPEFPEYGRAVTIRHLLNHTSGLPDYEDLMPTTDPTLPIEQVQIKDVGVLELLKKEKSGKFIPGTRWTYSNSGYVVLGLVVQGISGRPFAEFLRERIFAPLKMEGTLARESGKTNVPNRAYGHTRQDGGWRETDQSPTSATLGDGGIYSSLSDLLKWDEALRRHTLLSEAEMRPALTPVAVREGPPTEPDGTPADYGFGWFLNPWKGRARMWHYGETMGFRTAIQRFTKDGLTVIVLCNRADLDARALALQTAGFFLFPPSSTGIPEPVIQSRSAEVTEDR
jgi:CubicO group peptidase (beta-lactamase class C family)